MEVYRIVILRSGQPKKVIESGLSKKDAAEKLADWEKIFNSEVFFDPVPKVRMEMDVPEGQS